MNRCSLRLKPLPLTEIKVSRFSFDALMQLMYFLSLFSVQVCFCKILFHLGGAFPSGGTTLVSCVAHRPKESADRHCIVAVRHFVARDDGRPEASFRELVLME